MKKLFVISVVLFSVAANAAASKKLTPEEQLEQAAEKGRMTEARGLLGKLSTTVKPSVADKLYLYEIKESCDDGTLSEREKNNLQAVAGVTSYDYVAGQSMLRQVADFAAGKVENTNVAICVFDAVSRYKLAGVEFIDMMQESAEFFDAAELKTVISQLRDEIQKMQD